MSSSKLEPFFEPGLLNEFIGPAASAAETELDGLLITEFVIVFDKSGICGFNGDVCPLETYEGGPLQPRPTLNLSFKVSCAVRIRILKIKLRDQYLKMVKNSWVV